jgi:hypothetical protein
VRTIKTLPNDLAKKLTKREYFAALMVQAQLSNGMRTPMMLKLAVEFADKLIELLNQKDVEKGK